MGRECPTQPYRDWSKSEAPTGDTREKSKFDTAFDLQKVTHY